MQQKCIVSLHWDSAGGFCPCTGEARFDTQRGAERTLPLFGSVVWSRARGWGGRLLAISTQTGRAHACVSLSVEGSQPVSAHWPTTTLLISLAHCHTHTLETIKVEENGTGRKWPEVWAHSPHSYYCSPRL